MIDYKLAILAILLFVVVCCGIDALLRRRKDRIGITTCGGNDGDGGTSGDCGSGDGGGCD
jgi:hypothetical protein